jgi:hypothetical protein
MARASFTDISWREQVIQIYHGESKLHFDEMMTSGFFDKGGVIEHHCLQLSFHDKHCCFWIVLTRNGSLTSVAF